MSYRQLTPEIAMKVKRKCCEQMATAKAPCVKLPLPARPQNIARRSRGLDRGARLGHALDGVDRPHTADSVFAAMAAEEPAFKGLSLANLGEHGTDLAAAELVASSPSF